MPKRVLVVEDESLVAMLIEDLLAEFGCEMVGPARSAPDAMALLHASDFDLVLLDVNLGDGANSFAVADFLRRRAVPFAFLTGYGADGVRPDLRDAPVLSKPVDAAALGRVVGDKTSVSRRGRRRSDPLV